MRVKAVALAFVGTFYDMNGRKVEFSEKDLRDMERDEYPEGEHVPHVHLGHPNSTFMPQQPAFGSIERTYFDGKYLRADYKNVTPWAAQDILHTGRFPNRSMELGRIDGKMRLNGVGHLGSSSPAIKGLPQITVDQCSFMEPAEYGFNEMDENIICLHSEDEGGTPTPEETMLPISEEDFAKLQEQVQGLAGSVTKLQGEKDELSAELDAAKQENAGLKTSLEAQVRNSEAQRFESARSDVYNFTGRLHSEGVLSAGHVAADQVNLPAVLLHIKLHCPDLELNGEKIDIYSKLQESFELLQELRPDAREFSEYERKPPAHDPDSKDPEARRLAAAEKLMLENKGMTLVEALQQVEGEIKR